MWDAIALHAYGDEKMAAYLMAANTRYCDVIVFSAGCVLDVPAAPAADRPDSLPPWRRETE